MTETSLPATTATVLPIENGSAVVGGLGALASLDATGAPINQPPARELPATATEETEKRQHVTDAVNHVVTLVRLAEMCEHGAAKVGQHTMFSTLYAERAAAIRWALERLV
jgi:hypothetical protein